tara:strand:- start:228 stop:599 length:372 start_codon:yes stop_codon:yes gene_type:complete
MKQEFILYEQALSLKELDFNETCLGYCNSFFKNDIIKEGINGCVNSALESNEVTLPLYQQAFRWFREKYNLHTTIHPDKWCEISKDGLVVKDTCSYKTYKEAEIECLKKLIEIVKGDFNHNGD